MSKFDLSLPSKRWGAIDACAVHFEQYAQRAPPTRPEFRTKLAQVAKWAAVDNKVPDVVDTHSMRAGCGASLFPAE